MLHELRHPWREAIRSLWFLPAVFVVAALAAGYLLSQIEVADGGPFDPILFRGTAEAARELLIVVSGTMITVTGLVFVLTVVALQIASTQFSPRLLRSFLQDPGTRLVLSTFVATFAYSLGGLFTVGQVDARGEAFVPQLAVTGSLVLALISVGMLVYYIQHITNSIRIDAVMLSVRQATLDAIDTHYPHRVDARPDPPAPLHAPEDAALVPVRRSGYLQEVDIAALARLGQELDLSIRLRPQVGHHLVAGSALAWVWSEAGAPVDAGRLAAALDRHVMLTVERRVDMDVGFGIRQLVDIALRAVAPSMNDPYTAVQAVQHCSIVMTELATRATDDISVGERNRVYVPVPDFMLFLDTVCSNLRRNAADRPRVMVALLRMLETVAASPTSPERRKAVAHQIELIVDAARRAIDTPSDLEPMLAMAAGASFAAEHGYVDHV